jgi:hypothetical protein
MRTFAVMITMALLFVLLAGCVQPRVGSLEYSDQYGPDKSFPDRHWWGDSRPTSNMDVETFLFKNRGFRR